MSDRITKQHLIEQGVNALKQAETVVNVDGDRAQVWADIGHVYARLAEALGDKTITPRRAGYSW